MGAGAALLVLPGEAAAQEMGHGGRLAAGQIGTGISAGVAQGIAVMLVGLVAFAVVVWIPASRPYPELRDAGRPFARGAWALAGALAVVGAVDLCIYAVRATGDALSPGLLWEALFGTRTGWIWLARLLLGGLTALVAT